MTASTSASLTVLAAVKDLMAERGYPPSFQEIADRLGYSSRVTVMKHLRRLRSDGFVDYNDYEARTLRLLAEVER